MIPAKTLSNNEYVAQTGHLYDQASLPVEELVHPPSHTTFDLQSVVSQGCARSWWSHTMRSDLYLTLFDDQTVRQSRDLEWNQILLGFFFKCGNRMTLMTFCYNHRLVPYSVVISFLLQQVGTNTETLSQTLWRERETLVSTAPNRLFYQIFALRA